MKGSGGVSEVFRDGRAGALLAAVLAAAAFCYLGGMTASFSSDDYPHLLKNVHFDGLLEALSVFTEFDGREYRPIVRLSVWLNHRITRDATAFHYTNLILHLAGVVCVYFLLVLLLECRKQALLGGLLFALHPIHTTNVFFIYGRTDLVFGLFYLISLCCFLSYWKYGRERKHHVLSLVFFILGLLSKEMAVSLPILIFALLMVMGTSNVKERAMDAARHTRAYFLISLAYVAVRFHHWAGIPGEVSVYLDYDPLSVLKNLAGWLFALVYPWDLYRTRSLFENDPLIFLFIVFSILAVFLIAFFFTIRKRWRVFLTDRTILLGVVWFVVTLLPIVGGNAHRWYLYVPSVGLSLALAAIWRLMPGSRTFHVFLAVVSVSYSFEIMKQAGIWKTQGEISRTFLNQIRNVDSDGSGTYYFANMPFGYKSSFLFTFDSIIPAVSFHFGFTPDVRILSYVNLSDESNITRYSTGNGLGFRIEPDAYGAFLFPPVRRRFDSEGTVLEIDGVAVVIGDLSPAGTVTGYEISWPPDRLHPLYYHDGRRIRRFER